jgi:hypothetical protein
MINRSRKIVMGSAMDLYCGRSTLHKLEAAQATHGKPFIQASDQGPKDAVLDSRGAPPRRELLILPILADEVQTGAGMTEVERSRAAPTSIIGGYGRASRAIINHGADETPRERYPSLSSLLCLLPGFFLRAPARLCCPRATCTGTFLKLWETLI